MKINPIETSKTPQTRVPQGCTRMRQKQRALTRSQFRFMTVDCRSDQMNAGSFANNLGLLARIDAILQVGAISIAGRYN